MQHSFITCEGPGRLTMWRGSSGNWTQRRLDAEGLWPCFAPAADALAISNLKDDRGTIVLLDGDGHPERIAHEPPVGAPAVIAPRVPHYVTWAPDGRTLSFVAPGNESLGLYRSDLDGSYSSDRIATGAPVFHSWSADSRYIAVHTGAELSVFDTVARDLRTLSSSAVGFRAPVFVGNELVFAVPTPPQVTVKCVDPSGSADQRELGRFAGGLVLETIGGPTRRVSVAVTREPDSGSFHQLWLLDLDGGAPPELVARGPFAAALWAPAGDRFALVVPTQTGDGRYAVHVRDASGTFIAATEAIVPSQDFRTYLGFFDQYSISHRLWSPDGRAMLLAGRLPGDAIAWSFAAQPNDYVWYWPAERGAPLERIATGDSAFFAPSG